VFFMLMSSLWTFAGNDCFIAKEKDQILRRQGNCSERHSPNATFEIAIAIMGYNEGLLLDALTPEWPYEEDDSDGWLELWRRPHNPKSWIESSCVWYSRLVAKKLGYKKLKDYVVKFQYGNQDVSGDSGKNNGLTTSWLSSSLQISPVEQVEFLQKFINNKLSISVDAQSLTKNILFVEGFDGWKLYGKTGSADLLKSEVVSKDMKAGWFVGWIERGERKIVFAKYVELYVRNSETSGDVAKKAALEILKQIVH
jgi:beta-lactamase class D